MMQKIVVTGGSGFIGTHLVNDLIIRGYDILNIDISEPNLSDHKSLWIKIDILNKVKLVEAFSRFRPHIVVHLAANGGVNGKKLDDYMENTEGTQNVLEAIKSCESVERVVITSSQVVCRPGYIPISDTDFSPVIPYDISKVFTEKYTREANLNCTWTIIRPTYIWGPYHPRNANDLFLTIKKGWYLYPGTKPILRSYGYVKNVSWQIVELLKQNNETIHGKVFYVGDKAINYFDWINSFSLALLGKPVRTIPKFFLKGLAVIGDGISFVTSKPFLINSYRYLNMTEENIVNIDKTFSVLGDPPYNLTDAILETTKWLKSKI